MTPTATPSVPLIDDRLAKRNVLVLAMAQALAGGNQIVLVTAGGIVGTVLAPHKGLATLPISVMVIGMWLSTLPIGVVARRFGRRTAFQLGAGMGALAGLAMCSAKSSGLAKSRPSPASEIFMAVARTRRS